MNETTTPATVVDVASLPGLGLDTLRGLVRMSVPTVMNEVGQTDKALATAIAVKASLDLRTHLNTHLVSALARASKEQREVTQYGLRVDCAKNGCASVCADDGEVLPRGTARPVTERVNGHAVSIVEEKVVYSGWRDSTQHAGPDSGSGEGVAEGDGYRLRDGITAEAVAALREAAANMPLAWPGGSFEGAADWLRRRAEFFEVAIAAVARGEDPDVAIAALVDD